MILEWQNAPIGLKITVNLLGFFCFVLYYNSVVKLGIMIHVYSQMAGPILFSILSSANEMI